MGRWTLATGVLALSVPSLLPGTARGAAQSVLATGDASQLYADTASSLGATQTTYYMLLFTNHGHAACTLTGIPLAQPMDGPHHTPVGPPGFRSRQARRGGTVILTWRGGHRQADVYVSTEVVSELCRPRLNAGGVIVTFSPTLRFFLPTKYFQVCALRVTTTINGVAPGASGSM